MDALVLTRVQFAANGTFHILMPTICIGLAWLLLYFRWRCLTARRSDAVLAQGWLDACRFWTQVFALTFALGVLSGITMSFQSGTHWPGFMVLMGLSMLSYVVSDGYDLGVGMLMHRAGDAGQDVLIASIGPFWDASETWLVLGELCLTVALMLVGLRLRGVAFDFRVKAKHAHQQTWDRLFFAGSALASASQVRMLGRCLSGFGSGWNHALFAAASAVALPMACVLMRAAWPVMKTEGELQRRAVHWARMAWAPMVAGLILISMATPWVSATVRERWFSLPELIALMAIPLTTGTSLIAVLAVLRTKQVLDELTISQAASSPAALKAILVGACISVPAIAGYAVFSYRVFRGKTGELKYA